MQTQKKALGFWMLTALVAGNIIGSGVFLLPSSLAQYGSIGIIGWIFTSIGALCLALVFAKLGRLYPLFGGPYAYSKKAFGDFIGFSVAYTYWISMWIGNTAIVVVLIGYLSFFWPELARNPNLSFITGVMIIWSVTAINVMGVKPAGIVQLITTILKIIPLLIIIAIGFFFIHPHYLTVFNVSDHSHFSALSKTVVLTFWSFLGLESATIPVKDIENPSRNIPRATIVGVCIAAFIYIFSMIVIMGIVPIHDLAQSESPFAEAAYIIFGQLGGGIVAVSAIIAVFGTLNGWFFLQAQVPLAAARDRLFPKFFGKTSRKGTPVFGLIFSAILMTILLAINFEAGLVSQFTFIISLAVLAVLIPYLYTSMAEIILLIRYREHFPQIKNFRSIVIACLTFAYIIWIIIGSEKINVFYVTLLFFSCTPVYVWVQWRQRSGKIEADPVRKG